MERAVVETLAYSDIFDYPLRLRELHRYLTRRAEIDELPPVLETLRPLVCRQGDLYHLAGREAIVTTRMERETTARTKMPRAVKYGRIIGSLPFVRMVALTGSLAVSNSSDGSDLDYMLVTCAGRLWTARALTLLFDRFTRLTGHTICPNLIISESSLEWHQKDLYSARELSQMIPITGMSVYLRLMDANRWVRNFLPNADPVVQEQDNTFVPVIAVIIEKILGGRIGDRLEQWEMTRKIERFAKREGFGEETLFNAEICQGNFDHHRKETAILFADRLASLEMEVTVT